MEGSKVFDLVEDGLKITIELINAKLNGKFVIFSHGFGVKRDSKTLFTDISKILLQEYSIILFEYYDFDDRGNSTVPTYSIQIKKLEKVIEYVQKNFDPAEINIIAHSMGASIASAINSQNINRIIFMAIAVKPSYERLKKYFSELAKENFNEFGTTVITRKSGAKTFIPKQFWPELKTLDPKNNLEEKAKKFDCYLISAKNDERIPDSYDELKTIPNLKYFEIESNHLFEGNRDELLKMIDSLLSK